MKLFKTKAEAATASVVDEDTGRHTTDTVAEEIAALEAHLSEDPADTAAAELALFTLTPGAQTLLDRAMDNVAKNDGSGLEDPDARLTVKMRSSLVDAAGNDLSIVISALVASCDKPKEIAPTIYSLCYSVLKAAGFICNLDYRRYLDPRGDFDIGTYGRASALNEAQGDRGFNPDSRYDTSPLEGQSGHDTGIDRELDFWRSLYGHGIEDVEDVFARSLEDLRLFLQLTVESFGWDPTRPMPFTNIAESDGTFTPINDPVQALNSFELRRQESRKKRQDADNTRMAAAALKAQEMVTKALARRA